MSNNANMGTVIVKMKVPYIDLIPRVIGARTRSFLGAALFAITDPFKNDH